MLKPEDERFIGRLVSQEVAKAGAGGAPAAPPPSGYTGTFAFDDGTGAILTVTVDNGIIKSVA